MENVRGAVLFYDGECGLCRALVRWLARADRRAVLRFAPLQGAFAQAALRRCGLPPTDFDSLVFMPEINGPDYSLRTGGVIATLSKLGGGWRLVARLLAAVPVSWRDTAYRAVARVRFRIFGRVEFRADEPPDPKQAERFLT
ncbi:MAG: DCC1-like thiol-disulfide oxidoreductase family protein [Verrucomicrobia bacterium]|nr:DCC1-like thiol-disulfide oxidoreductase family protein [Verrucomicrobiota bacterium]